jgi:hypothetical protein
MELMPFKFDDNVTVGHINAAYAIIDEFYAKIKVLRVEDKELKKNIDLFGIERTKNK